MMYQRINGDEQIYPYIVNQYASSCLYLQIIEFLIQKLINKASCPLCYQYPPPPIDIFMVIVSKVMCQKTQKKLFVVRVSVFSHDTLLDNHNYCTCFAKLVNLCISGCVQKSIHGRNLVFVRFDRLHIQLKRHTWAFL